VGCADRTINHSPGGTTVAIAAASATIDTPTNVELSSGVLRSAATGSTSYGCAYNAAGADSATVSTSYNTLEVISSTARSQANLFSAPSYMKINSLTLRVRKVGGPTTDMYAKVQAGSGLDPSGAALATSPGYPINATITSVFAVGQLITFALPTPLEVTSGGLYAISLNVASNTSLDGANNILWVVSDSVGPPEACSGFPLYRYSADTGATWGVGNNSNYRRGLFTVNVDQHATSGTASWILDAQRATAVWSMSTFSFTENPSGKYGGTITYDVGVGDSSTTAAYSSLAQTKAQIRELSNLTGRYLYVRANFNVANPGYDVAALGDGGIIYQ
jgi:hypothetical protein